jgi:methionyl-tRNA formyltransferase
VELKLVFLGTPRFAVPSLQALVNAGHQVAAVFTQPDRPRGRGQQTGMPPVKEAALAAGLSVHQPEKVRNPEVVQFLRSLAPEAIVVVGYGQIIPQSIIDIPPLGVINVHASLLPKYRGAAPIQWAIANGETRTGVTTMRIDAGLDTGDVLLKWECEIGPEDTAVTLGERLAEAGARLLLETLNGLASGTIQPEPQKHAEATLAPQLKKEDGRIDWNWPARQIDCRIRGFQPWPGGYTTFRGQTLEIHRARPVDEPAEGPPGALSPDRRRLFAACGEGTVLELLEVQPAGRKQMTVEAFLNGYRPVKGERLGD